VTTDKISSTVLEAFAEVMGEPAPRGADTVPDDVEMWTSLTHVHLIMEIELRLGLSLPAGALTSGEPLCGVIEAARASGR
jgi:acyl carrier protein